MDSLTVPAGAMNESTTANALAWVGIGLPNGSECPLSLRIMLIFVRVRGALLVSTMQAFLSCAGCC